MRLRNVTDTYLSCWDKAHSIHCHVWHRTKSWPGFITRINGNHRASKSLKMTWLSVYLRTTCHRPCLIISFQPLCRHRSPLGLRRCSILSERKRARECLTDQAERMVKRSRIGLQAVNRGQCCSGRGPSQHPRCHHRQE